MPDCRIDLGLRIEHPVGVVVGRGDTIGKDVTLFEGVTFGLRNTLALNSGAMPILGNRVKAGANACILGRVSIPAGRLVRPNSVVSDSDKPK